MAIKHEDGSVTLSAKELKCCATFLELSEDEFLNFLSESGNAQGGSRLHGMPQHRSEKKSRLLDRPFSKHPRLSLAPALPRAFVNPPLSTKTVDKVA